MSANSTWSESEYGVLTAFSYPNFESEFPQTHSQNLIYYHWLSMLANSKILHFGIPFNMPCWVSAHRLEFPHCPVQVRLEMWSSSGTFLKYIEYNADGSSATDWFSAGRFVSSSWSDLHSGVTHNYWAMGWVVGALKACVTVNMACSHWIYLPNNVNIWSNIVICYSAKFWLTES